MKNSTALHTHRNKTVILAVAVIALFAVAAISLMVGKYPLTIEGLISGNTMQWKVFLNLRLTRVLVGVIGGFALGVAGCVYQTVFRNPLASPDIIGVASGASAGAAAGILFLSGTAAITATSFAGALIAVVFTIALASIDRTGKNSTTVLAGIAVHALAQTVLMSLKLVADPEKELASIEYWIMGSLNGINLNSAIYNMIIAVVCMVVLFLLHRQTVLLATEESEAKMLGVSVGRLRLIVLLVATLVVAAVISLTGLISFIGLLAPHGARLIMKNNRRTVMWLSGLFGGIILSIADICARSVAKTELPISIFTSLVGAPFLIYLIVRERNRT